MNPAAAARVTGFSVEEYLATTVEDGGSIYQERATIIIGPGGQVLGTQVVGWRTIRLPPPPPPPPPSPILNLNEDPEGWTRDFAENYYTSLDSDRGALAPLFQDGSMLTFQGHQILGAHNIMAKLTSLPDYWHHIVTAVDWQPSPAYGGMLVFVTGALHLSGEQQVRYKFTEMFHLIPTPQGGYYVLNDIFRLNGA